ncbi:hypothetical protein FA15DRAFT_686937 [Coprinopsis marcescibilis]|uniref:TECPR1-like DysF domain-containing protein n=1 Tax=Coprinopsis marcescibilis TaxID=230819 RepID=A0A5C3KY43_COPMA|nr:hypothetical protein FA15DRAFT_686937 [Coprinopsis marcescibilis]
MIQQQFVLNDFLNSAPSPLTFALVSLSDSIASLLAVLHVLSWRNNTPLDGFLAVAAWWAVCCFAVPVIKFFLPPAIVAVAVYSARRKQAPRADIVTESLLQNTIAHLTSLSVLLPSFQVPQQLASLSVYSLVRAAVIVYVPYLAVTYLVPLRIILAISGTLLLTWQAPFAIILRKVLWRSAFVRWATYTLWAQVSGQPLPLKAISPQTLHLASVETEETAPATTTSLRFLFTVYENQRWWMGLDWTAALLPGERPSWCSTSQAPLSPPGAFTLPEPATTYIPYPLDTTKKVKRTAEWYWEEPEWRVLVKKEGSSLSRVERPLPQDPESEDGTANNTSSRLFKAASSKFSSSSSVHSKESSSNARQDEDSQSVHGEDGGSDSYTDPDGWVYGDNKWESKSNKGGMSKYTRYRRWTRIAVLTEFTQVVEATAENTPDRRSKARPLPIKVEEKDVAIPSAPTTPISARSADSPLRQRLRMALNKGTS